MVFDYRPKSPAYTGNMRWSVIRKNEPGAEVVSYMQTEREADDVAWAFNHVYRTDSFKSVENDFWRGY